MTAGPRDDPFGGPVLVIGSGLIGASIAMALTQAGIETYVRDVDPAVAHVAASRGAGSDTSPPIAPGLVVVATPPDALGAAIDSALQEFPAAVVTDVGSVKAKPLAALGHRDTSRYVGGHPMAGSERSGPMAAAADLFEGRTWAVVVRDGCSPEAVEAVERLVARCGAVAVRMSTDEHDAAVARVSHVPHVVAALIAATLVDAPAAHLALSGPGLRDMTRIASSDPALWRQILTANAPAVRPLLARIRSDIDELLSAIESSDGSSVTTSVARVLEAGVAGTAAIPGKHGQPAQPLATVTVVIPDMPGALARLFADAGDAGINIEDVRMDHDPARAYGLIEIDVVGDRADALVTALKDRAWSVHR